MKNFNFLTIANTFLKNLSVETKLICVLGMAYGWPVYNLCFKSSQPVVYFWRLEGP